MAKAPETLKIDDQAPEFTLPAYPRGEISLADYRAKQPVILYFYPRDATPGCTQEACSFRDLNREFAVAGAVILGVSPQDLESHRKFAQAHHLTFPLLYDEDGRVATQYGAYGEKTLAGRSYVGNYRVTYLIDQEGRIARVWPKVTVEGHADEVLTAVRELTGAKPG